MKKSVKQIITGAVIAAGLMSGARGGMPYVFTVSCPNGTQVVEWAVAGIDPGKAFLRASTGAAFPGCTVADYQEKDAALPRIYHGHEETMLTVVPVIGSVIISLIERH